MTDFYQRGQDLGLAYYDGQGMAQQRQKTQADIDATKAQTARVQGITQGEQADRDTMAAQRAGVASAYANTPDAAPPATGLPTPGVTDPNTGVASDPNTTDPNAPPAAFPVNPSGPAGATAPQLGAQYQSGRGARARMLADAYKQNPALSQQYSQQAVDFDKSDIYNAGAAIAKDPTQLNAALRMVNIKDPSLTVAQGKDGVYRMTMVSPDGTAHEEQLTGKDLAHLMGAQALMQHGYVQDALPLFGQVSGALAATVALRNQDNTSIGNFNNKAENDSQNSDARMLAANARMDSANAMATRAQAFADRQPSGAPVQLVDNQGVAHVFTRGPDGQMVEQQLPPGMHLPRQAADPKEVTTLAQTFVGMPTGRTVNGAPEKYTPETAYAAAARVIQSGGQNPAGPGGGGFAVPASASPADAVAAVKSGATAPGGLPVPGPAPKFIRSPGAHGGYSYTASPRGLTMADYAAIDKQQGK